MFGQKSESNQKSKLPLRLLYLGLFFAWTAGIMILGSDNSGWIKKSFFAEEAVLIEGSKNQYFPMERVIISINGDKEDLPHYLLLELSLKSGDSAIREVLHDADPLIRNTLMKMFSKKPYAELRDTDQIDALQQEALQKITKVLDEHEFPSQIDEVLFTRMVIQ